ncbi:hypothetical protein ID866_10461 [Astraeus odoratus]|nr:hypothetical protein ID866_10461 [Astraeus odoratus]
MFARVFAVASLAALAIANPLSARQQCQNGSIQCCNTVPQSFQYLSAYGKHNVADVIAMLSATADVSCSPIGVLSGNSCTQQTVCCNDTEFNGVVNVGCSNISL